LQSTTKTHSCYKKYYPTPIFNWRYVRKSYPKCVNCIAPTQQWNLDVGQLTMVREPKLITVIIIIVVLLIEPRSRYMSPTSTTSKFIAWVLVVAIVVVHYANDSFNHHC
jgi:hypothetical protein